jgi:large subunit ribosomal protein L1
MARLSKRQKIASEKIGTNTQYAIDEALSLVKEFATTKFPESIDISVNLGIDSRKSDQVIRGSTVLPNGTGKNIRVAVFAQGENAIKAKDAGADIVGFEDLAETIKKGELNFDVVIATPDSMRLVGQLGQVLGPRGLMPNPKVGTVTADVQTAVQNAKTGQVRYRTDKGGIIHCSIGKANFEIGALKENLITLLSDLKRARPSSVKGLFLKKMTISSTMGPGVTIDQASIDI